MSPNIVMRLSPSAPAAIVDLGGYETRNLSTANLLRAGAELVSVRRPFEIPVITSDGVADRSASTCFAYSKPEANGDDSTILMPDFAFQAWPEVGIGDYDAVCADMVRRSRMPPAHDELFWIGNTAMHPTRQQFVQMAEGDRRIKAHGMDWDRHNMVHGQRLNTFGPYVSLPDHCDYKYLIDLQGYAYSARLKILMFSGRPLFVQKRRWIEYFLGDLRAWEHYIPVREDLSDLSDRLDWAEANHHEATRIAANAQHYAVHHLTRQRAVERMAGCIRIAQDAA